MRASDLEKFLTKNRTFILSGLILLTNSKITESITAYNLMLHTAEQQLSIPKPTGSTGLQEVHVHLYSGLTTFQVNSRVHIIDG